MSPFICFIEIVFSFENCFCVYKQILIRNKSLTIDQLF